MQNKINQFDSFLTKTIIGNAKLYYKRKVRLNNLEELEKDSNDKNTFFSDELLSSNNLIDNLESKIVLENAIERLSALEQAVIFLLFHQDKPHEIIAKELDIYSSSVSRIKTRALKKLKDLIEKGDL